LLCVLGGGNAVAAAVKGLHGDSAWSTGEVHAVLFGAPTLAAFGAVYHWAPKIWGRVLHAGLGALQFLLMFGGFVVSAAGSWALGSQGAPWRIDDLTGAGSKGSWLAFSRLEGVGGVLITLGVLVFVVNLAVSRRAAPTDDLDDPYEGSTLEWATTSPPLEENFTYLPEIYSDAPLADLRATRAAVDGGAA
jgi:cytochrome c oxidase subunit 1